MSSFIGIIEPKFVILGTDTLTTYPTKEGDTKIKPRSYSCKSFLLPQFQSAFAVTGILQTGLCFFNYIVENAFGIDIDSLTNIDLQIFREKLESEYPSFPSGNIYLMGYSNKMECFKNFKLQIKKDTKLEWKKIKSNSFIHKPEVKNWEEKISPNDESNYEEIIVNLMKTQKKEDEQRTLVEQVGIGGQIVLNQLGHDKQGKFNIISKIIHEFNDYETLGNQMFQNRNDRKKLKMFKKELSISSQHSALKNFFNLEHYQQLFANETYYYWNQLWQIIHYTKAYRQGIEIALLLMDKFEEYHDNFDEKDTNSGFKLSFLYGLRKRKELIERKLKKARKGGKIGNYLHEQQDELTDDEIKERYEWMIKFFKTGEYDFSPPASRQKKKRREKKNNEVGN